MGRRAVGLPLVFPGGNWLTDGVGTFVFTTAILMENNMSREEFTRILSSHLRVTSIHFIPSTNVRGLQPVDTTATFIDENTILVKQVSHDHPEHDCLAGIARDFEMLRDRPTPLQVRRVLCPSVRGAPWERDAVAAYTNSLIVNDAILVPLYGIDSDVAALQTYRRLAPKHTVIGILHNPLTPWWGEDAVHCRSIGLFGERHKPMPSSRASATEYTRHTPILDAPGTRDQCQ